MADKKISALTAASTPLAGTEVLPIVQSGSTVKVSVDNLTTGKTVAMNQINLQNSTVGFPTLGTASGSLRLLGSGGGGFGLFGGLDGGTGRSWLQAMRTDGPVAYDLRLQPVGGNVRIGTGDVIIETAGKGIDFSANTHAAGMTSELLDWYEEGTFTPSFNQGFTAPVTYTTQTGRYTRIGDLVYFHIYIFMAAGQTRNSDALSITGLPFAAASGIINGCTWGYASGVVVAGTALPTLYLGGTSGIFYNTGGAAFTGLTLTSARPEIAISGVYKTT